MTAFVSVAIERLRENDELRAAIEAAVARRLLADRQAQEPWLDKRGLAEHLSCSARWIEERMTEGLPHAMIAGRAKFRASVIEPWLDAHGHIVTATRLRNRSPDGTLRVTGSENGAGTAPTAPRPTIGGVNSNGS